MTSAPVGRVPVWIVALTLLIGCNRGRECSDGASCYAQAKDLIEKIYQNGGAKKAAPETAADRAKTVALLQKGCDLGSGSSCNTLGFWLEDGDLAPLDLPRAAQLHERGCALKEFRSCDRLAKMYREGRGVPQDLAQQAKYRKLACDMAEPPGAKESFCEHEGPEQAMQHDCSDGYGCYMQAQLLSSSFFDVQRPLYHAQTGKDKPSPETLAAWSARAVVLLQKGCDLGDGQCCSTLGSDFTIGGMTGVDLPRAARYFEKGCALKDAGSCDQLARVYRDGEGAPKNPALHAKYRKLACAFADQESKEIYCKDNK